MTAWMALFAAVYTAVTLGQLSVVSLLFVAVNKDGRIQ